MQIKTIIAGAIAGICLAAPVFAADGHDAMRSHDIGGLSGTLTGSVLDGWVSGKFGDYSNTTDSAADPYTAEARAEESRRERADRQARIQHNLKKAEAKAKAKEKADRKAGREKRSNREKSASRERRRDK